jgi:hypothetical protein
MFNNIVEPYGNPAASAHATSAELPWQSGDISLTSGPLDDISQLWLWTDDDNDNWFSSFS